MGRRCFLGMDSGWGGYGAREGMRTREKTNSGEKMCPWGWKKRRGWGEDIPQGKDVSLEIWGQGECCNPDLGLATKARGCKVVGQKEARESHLMSPRVQKSVRE
jgi:hypothetical protein